MKIRPAGSVTSTMKRSSPGASPKRAWAATPSNSPASSPISMRSGSPRLMVRRPGEPPG